MALLRLESVEKSFAGVPALRPATLELEAGEILGLIGENGAGKSTLIKLLSGVHAPDRGTIEWQGRKVRFASPRDAIDAGIATIHQELSYFGRLSVAENLLLAERWPRRAWGGVDWRRLYAAADERLRSVGIDVSSRRMLDSLSAAEKQEVAIARALCRDARLLILDEP
ncbi:MAG TPA: ATP-binding cassette domain-containing protein, partial [Planctomycetota bacterium]|nr:ATP-binding cassette domain-containing protein [Planctomycetota bacterium]